MIAREMGRCCVGRSTSGVWREGGGKGWWCPLWRAAGGRHPASCSCRGFRSRWWTIRACCLAEWRLLIWYVVRNLLLSSSMLFLMRLYLVVCCEDLGLISSVNFWISLWHLLWAVSSRHVRFRSIVSSHVAFLDHRRQWLRHGELVLSVVKWSSGQTLPEPSHNETGCEVYCPTYESPVSNYCWLAYTAGKGC